LSRRSLDQVDPQRRRHVPLAAGVPVTAYGSGQPPQSGRPFRSDRHHSNLTSSIQPTVINLTVINLTVINPI
jgi:hypothetical protein